MKKLTVKNFNEDVRTALMNHCQVTLGHRGANKYLEALIRRDLGLK